MGKQEQEDIRYAELVRVRKDEMESILPGFYTQVVEGDKITEVKSPDVMERWFRR